LCLLQTAAAWTGAELAAELVVKAAGWFLEFLLMQASVIQAMTTGGIANGDELDHLLNPEAGDSSHRPGAGGAG
jgi:hypothetical protein